MILCFVRNNKLALRRQPLAYGGQKYIGLLVLQRVTLNSQLNVETIIETRNPLT